MITIMILLSSHNIKCVNTDQIDQLHTDNLVQMHNIFSQPTEQPRQD